MIPWLDPYVDADQCRTELQPQIRQEVSEFHLESLVNDLQDKIDPICLEMGTQCHGRRLAFALQRDKLEGTIDALTEDEETRTQLVQCARKVIEIAREYFYQQIYFPLEARRSQLSNPTNEG